MSNRRMLILIAATALIAPLTFAADIPPARIDMIGAEKALSLNPRGTEAMEMLRG